MFGTSEGTHCVTAQTDIAAMVGNSSEIPHISDWCPFRDRRRIDKTFSLCHDDYSTGFCVFFFTILGKFDGWLPDTPLKSAVRCVCRWRFTGITAVY